MSFSKKLLSSLLGLFLVFGQVVAKPTNEILRIGMNQEFENLNPVIAQMLATTYIYGMVGRRLNVIDPDGNWVPQLATKTPTLENGLAKKIKVGGQDKIVATWTLKDEAKWGDGKPVTADDVIFSWKLGSSKNVSTANAETYTKIEKIEKDAKNPKKFTLTFEKAEWDFYKMADFAVLPKHLESPVFKKYGNEKEGYSKNSLYSSDPTNPGLYNGPYVIQEIKLGSHITMVPNKHFYGKKPAIKKIILKVIPNTGTMEANLRSGRIDMISILGLTLDQAIALDKKAKKEKASFQVNFQPGLVYEHIDLQLNNPVLKDVNVRKALVYAIDRKKLTEALFEGKQAPAVHNIAPIDSWFTDDPSKIVVYKPSRRKAKKLLDKAGWKLKDDGYRYKDGQKLSFQLMTTAGNKLRELVQVYLQNEWKKVGVDITIKNEPARVYFGETVRKSKFPAMALFAWISSPESSPKSTFHSSMIPSKDNGYSGQNGMRWKNSTVDKLLDKLDVTFDSNSRTKIVHNLLKHYTDEVPVIPLYYRSNISVTPKNLTGYKVVSHQYSDSNHVEDWVLQ